MNQHAWQGMMERLSIDANLDVLQELQAAYSQKHRHYHTSAHIDSCLALLAEHRVHAPNPGEVECAIWFHDAIYNPMSGDNEAKSAEWAVRFLAKNHCPETLCDRVRELILATVHDAPAIDPDTQLLIDIDLAILGAEQVVYDEFELNVRREYKWVPGPLFRRERKKILQSFLDRQNIYATIPLRKKYEARARHNIERVLRTL